MWGLAREKGYVDNRYLRYCYENLIVGVPTPFEVQIFKTYRIRDRRRQELSFYFTFTLLFFSICILGLQKVLISKTKIFFCYKTSTWASKAQNCMLVSSSEMWVEKSPKNYTN